MADSDRNADRIASVREDLDSMRETLRDEITSAKTLAARWGFRLFMAHIGVGLSIIAGLILALVT